MSQTQRGPLLAPPGTVSVVRIVPSHRPNIPSAGCGSMVPRPPLPSTFGPAAGPRGRNRPPSPLLRCGRPGMTHGHIISPTAFHMCPPPPHGYSIAMSPRWGGGAAEGTAGVQLDSFARDALASAPIGCVGTRPQGGRMAGPSACTTFPSFDFIPSIRI